MYIFIVNMIIFISMILKSERLTLELVKVDDAPFYFHLFNDKDWIKFIRDTNLKSVTETKIYLQETLIPNFNKNGLGFFTVSISETSEKIGVATLIKREKLEHIDVGYGFLPKGRGKGFAREATKRILKYLKEDLKQQKVLAFTKPNNRRSQELLKKLDFNFVSLQAVFDENEDAVYEYEF